jgi:hypothetical protein
MPGRRSWLSSKLDASTDVASSGRRDWAYERVRPRSTSRPRASGSGSGTPWSSSVPATIASASAGVTSNETPRRIQRDIDSSGCAFLAATSAATLSAVHNWRSISAQRVVQSSAVGSRPPFAPSTWPGRAPVFTEVIVLLAMYATPSSMLPRSLMTRAMVVDALAIVLLDESPVWHTSTTCDSCEGLGQCTGRAHLVERRKIQASAA